MRDELDAVNSELVFLGVSKKLLIPPLPKFASLQGILLHSAGAYRGAGKTDLPNPSSLDTIFSITKCLQRWSECYKKKLKPVRTVISFSPCVLA